MTDEKRYTELKKLLRAALISVKRDGVTMHHLEQMYREQEGRKIPLLGYRDLFSLLNSMNDTVYTVRLKKWRDGQVLVFPVTNENTQHISDLVAGQNTSKSRAGRKPASRKLHADNFGRGSMYGSTRKLNTSFNSTKPSQFDGHGSRKPSASVYSYASSYQKYADSYVTPRTHRDDEISQFNGALDLSSDYTHTNLKIKPQTNNVYRKRYGENSNDHSNDSYGKTNGTNDKQTDEKDDSSDGLQFNCDLLLFDEHHIEFGDLPRIKFTDTFHDGQHLRIFLAQIHSPYKFWFQRKDDIDNIETLMNALEHYYHSEDNMISKSPMPANYLQLGRICAALYDGQWHRAEIIDVFEESVKVFYVDYGTIGEVENKNVRFLHKRFSQDPIFANRGCLDRCKPNNGIWSLEAMEAFSQRLLEYFEIPMLAKVTNVNAEEKTVYLDLVDTSGVVDLSISHWLIDNNFAYSTKKKLLDFTKRHYNEVYPSFDRLETGRYPSLAEMKKMLDDGCDFLEYEDSIIIPEMYGYETIE